jgi:hypothetical protein
MNKDIHNKFLKEVYKRILREDATKYNQTQQPEITRPEKGGVINRVPDMLSSTQPDVNHSLQIDRMDGIQEVGGGWWRINGQMYFLGPDWIPFGFNEHGVLIIIPSVGGFPRPDPNHRPRDRFDQFPRNPAHGDTTRIRGTDGRIHFYIFHGGPPARWIHTDGYFYADNNPALPPGLRGRPRWQNFGFDNNTGEWGFDPTEVPNSPYVPSLKPLFPPANFPHQDGGPSFITPNQLPYPPANPDDPYSDFPTAPPGDQQYPQYGLPGGAGGPLGPPSPWWWNFPN